MPYAKKTNSPASPSPCINFVAEPCHYNIPDAELLDDLAKVARQLGVIHPWSQGGETTKENLQTLCDTCNAGKSDTM